MQQIQEQRRSGPSLETLIFKMGGFNGAVRRVIAHWERPFTVNQVKVAIVRRHPELLPADSQIEDIVVWLVKIGKLERIDESTFRHALPAAKSPKFIGTKMSRRERQLRFLFQ